MTNNIESYRKKLNLSRKELADKVGVTFEARLTFETQGIYALLKENVSVVDGRVQESDESIFTFHEGMSVYADKVGESGLVVGERYIVAEVDIGDCNFCLLNERGEKVNILSGGFNLHQCISGVELFVTNVQSSFEDDSVLDSTFQVKAHKYGNPLILSRYEGVAAPTPPIADFSHIKNVVAEWYSPVFDFGTNESSKTLLKMTISTEPEVNGKISFGYETRQANRLIGARGINIFSFENFSFENFTFDTAFANSYSVKANERNFNFIIFRFVSDNDCNCAVNTFTAIYKINKENKGVR